MDRSSQGGCYRDPTAALPPSPPLLQRILMLMTNRLGFGTGFCRSAVLLAGLFLPLLLAPSASAQLRAGAATSNITPQLGGEIVGNFLPIVATHIHDQLHARCLVLDDGQTRLAIVVCDLLGVHQAVCDTARQQIAQRLAIPAENVLISATHTHSAISAIGARLSFGSELNAYQQFVVSRIVDGVQCAANELRPAKLGWGQVDVPEHVFNRRWHMSEDYTATSPFGDVDQVKMNPPGGSPALVKPAGPTDPAVTILSVTDAQDVPLALYASYSLHYVGGVGPGHVSADYFGMFCQRLGDLIQQQQEADTSGFVPMLANGTSGDINNINFREPRPNRGAYHQMRYVAHDVAEKVAEAWSQIEHSSDVTLSAKMRQQPVQWRVPSPATLAWAEAKLAEPASDSRRADLPRIYAQRAIGMADHPRQTDVPLQLLTIGEGVIGTMPFEVFCEIGLQFKQQFAGRPAVLASLSQGYYGYLPSPAQHLLGGYETWLGTSRAQPPTSDELLQALFEMAAESE